MNKRSNLFYFIILLLTFFAGVLFGLAHSDYKIPINIEWNSELKFGDIISTLVAVITFFFAYKGLKDNREQFQISNKPILEVGRESNHHIGQIQLLCNNVGNGTALDIKTYFHIDGETMTFSEFSNMLKSISDIKIGNVMYFKVLSLGSSEKSELFDIKIEKEHIPEFHSKIMQRIFCRLSVTMEYKDIFGNEFQNTSKLY